MKTFDRGNGVGKQLIIVRVGRISKPGCDHESPAMLQVSAGRRGF